MADLLNIGLSGLSVNKTHLSVTGHNITNVNTPGYTRQSATQATTTPQFSGAGYIGSGTTLVDIRRSYSEFLTTQLRTSTALSADAAAYQSQIDQLDSLLAGSTTGITPSMQKFFSAMQTAAEDPANIPARQLVLAEAEGLARRFNTLYERLGEQNSFLNKQMTAVSDQVNRLAGSIGKLNDAIAVAKSNGKEPNDLLDARDEAVRELSQYIGVTVVPQDDSTQNIFIGTGQPLVVGSTVNKIEVVPGRSDPNRFEVDFVSGGSRQAVTTQISGGELGGLIRYREEVLDSSFNSLGRLALSISDQVNSQLGQGLDLKGQVGSNLFGDINADSLTKQRSFPAGLPVTITDTSKLTTSDYEVEFLTDTTFRIREAGGAWISVDGKGEFKVGQDIPGLGFSIGANEGGQNSYLVMPTRRGAADVSAVLTQPDQLAFAAPVRAESNLQNLGTGVVSQPVLVNAPESLSAAALSDLFGDAGISLSVAGAGTDNGQYNLELSNSLTGWELLTSGPFKSGESQTIQLKKNEYYTVELQISGRPAVGDGFDIMFNKNGVSDNRNALQLVDLQTKQTLNVNPDIPGSGMTFTDGYGELVERVGTLTAQARQDSDATSAILKQATDNRDSLSAVNLDEEAANLIKFQQYYNASAQIIQVARSLFDTLISTFR
ncbi:flagellar hook-associated protein FlgK [Pseudomonas sp. S5(2021)]|nr:flagellar hook-associated protein FlgK [Pseudomonas sp. S5(2021)]